MGWGWSRYIAHNQTRKFPKYAEIHRCAGYSPVFFAQLASKYLVANIVQRIYAAKALIQ